MIIWNKAKRLFFLTIYFTNIPINFQKPYQEKNEVISQLRNQHGSIKYQATFNAVLRSFQFLSTLSSSKTNKQSNKNNVKVYITVCLDCNFLRSNNLSTIFNFIKEPVIVMGSVFLME